MGGIGAVGGAGAAGAADVAGAAGGDQAAQQNEMLNQAFSQAIIAGARDQITGFMDQMQEAFDDSDEEE